MATNYLTYKNIFEDHLKAGTPIYVYSKQKQDWELTVAQIMNSLLPNSDLN